MLAFVCDAVQDLNTVVAALVLERGQELARVGLLYGVSLTPDWLGLATHLFLALDMFKWGHLDLDGEVIALLALKLLRGCCHSYCTHVRAECRRIFLACHHPVR